MKLTTRKSGGRMATFAIKFHATEELIDWVATKLGCSRARAFKAIRAAYEASLTSHVAWRTIVFDAESDEDKIKLVDREDEADDMTNQDDVYGGGLH